MPAAAPTFVAVKITDADQERGVRRSCPLYPSKADLRGTSQQVRFVPIVFSNSGSGCQALQRSSLPVVEPSA
jgi:hypothetical protein